MKSIKLTEVSFENKEIVDFQKNKKLLIVINLLSLVLFAIFYFLFHLIYSVLFNNKINDPLYFFRSFKNSSDIYSIVFILLLLLILLLHELIHGLFFYLYTGEKPVIGLKSIYAYAGAPNWYIRKDNFNVVSLSPLIIITIIGFVLMWIMPASYSPILFLCITANAAGSIGDIWISIKLINKPSETYINDTGLFSSINY